jgi:transposase
VTTELVPWAEPRSRFTREFEDMTAYLAQRTDQTTVSAMQRIAWETVGGIVGRVVERRGPTDRLDGLRNIGVDELSYRRHHEYVTVVVDHDRQRIVWAHPGKSADRSLSTRMRQPASRFSVPPGRSGRCWVC